jgi:hypothetical protein
VLSHRRGVLALSCGAGAPSRCSAFAPSSAPCSCALVHGHPQALARRRLPCRRQSATHMDASKLSEAELASKYLPSSSANPATGGSMYAQPASGGSLDGATEVKAGILWLNSTTQYGPQGVLIWNAENQTDKCCCLTAYQGRQHILMPLDQITHSHVLFAKQRQPTLLVVAALILLAGGYFSQKDWSPMGYAAAVALVLVCAYIFNSKTRMMAKFVSPTQEIAVYWNIEGSGSHNEASDNFGVCAAYKAVWQVEQARMALLATRR